MANKKYTISLSNEERTRLEEIVREGSAPKRAVLRARILLESDEAVHPARSHVLDLAKQLHTTHTTVQTVRTSYAEGGLEAAVFRKERVVSMETRKINTAVITRIWELSDEMPPEDHKRWTLKLLCREAMDRGIVSHIGTTAMSQIMRQKENR